MKPIQLVAALTLSLSIHSTAQEQPAANIASVAIRAQTTGVGKGSEKRTVNIHVRNGTDKAGAITVEVIWLSNGPDGKGSVSGISGVSRGVLTLPARGEGDVELTPGDSRGLRQYIEAGVKFQSALGFSGWIARAVNPSTGEILAIAANSEASKKWSEKVPVLKSN